MVYPKDAAQIVGGADVFPGARVLEAGVGSGALTLWLLRAVGPTGRLVSYERRDDFADIARRTSRASSAGRTRPGSCGSVTWSNRSPRPPEPAESFDRMVLDMLAPWECVDVAADLLVPGGVLCCYVATTTQLARTVETLRIHTGFTEPEAAETHAAELAGRGPGRPPEARDDRPHRLPDLHPAAGARRSGTVTQTSPSARRVRGRLPRAPLIWRVLFLDKEVCAMTGSMPERGRDGRPRDAQS